MLRTTNLACLTLLLLGACQSVGEGQPTAVETSESAATGEEFTQADLLDFLSRQDSSMADLAESQLNQVSKLRLDESFTSLELASLVRLPLLKEVTIWRDGEGRFGSEPSLAPTDEDLRVLAGISQLETIRIGGWNAPFTDAGIAELVRLPKLMHLHLIQAQGITDESMKSVARMQALESLNITYTHVSDRGLAFLLPAKNLERVRYGWAAESQRWLASFLSTHSEASFRVE